MIARLLMLLVRVYRRFVSPLIGPACRFEPSCSAYALACLQTHGAARGSLLSLTRLCKCHPLHPGGYDPPPPPKTSSAFLFPPRADQNGASPGAASAVHASSESTAR